MQLEEFLGTQEESQTGLQTDDWDQTVLGLHLTLQHEDVLGLKELVQH